MAEGREYRVEGGRSGQYGGEARAVNLGVRPEHISLGEAGAGQLDGVVDVCEYLGADTNVIVDAGTQGQINGPGRWRDGTESPAIRSAWRFPKRTSISLIPGAGGFPWNRTPIIKTHLIRQENA